MQRESTAMATSRLHVSALLFTLGALGGAAPATAAGCAGIQHCVDVPKFTAQLADFRAIEQSGRRQLIATVKFENKTGQPLTIGYVSGSGTGMDELGNRYTVSDSGGVRGIGLITRSNLDTRFTLQPGEKADARLELDWNAYDRIAGVEFKLEMALREIDALPGNQFRAGREHMVSFGGLRDGLLERAAIDIGLGLPGDAPARAVAAVDRAAVEREQQHAVGVADLREPVRDQQRRAALQHPANRRLDLVLRGAVDGAGRVVENENARLGDQRTGDGEALASAGRGMACRLTGHQWCSGSMRER